MSNQTWCILGVERDDTSLDRLSWSSPFVWSIGYSCIFSRVCGESRASQVPSLAWPSSDAVNEIRRNRDVEWGVVWSSSDVWTLTSHRLTVWWQLEHRNCVEGERWTLFDLNSVSAVRRRLFAAVAVWDEILGVVTEEVFVVSMDGGATKVGGKVGIKTLRCNVTGWFAPDV